MSLKPHSNERTLKATLELKMGNKHSISPEFKDYQQQVSIQSKRPTREGSITDKPTPDYSKLDISVSPQLQALYFNYPKIEDQEGSTIEKPILQQLVGGQERISAGPILSRQAGAQIG